MPPPDPSTVRIDGPWRHLDVHANGIRFHVVEADQRADTDDASRPFTDRPLVIMLHGFGSVWWTLAGDTAGLVRALGHNSATLVGHADGGLVCWATSVLHPRVVRAIAVVSSPHPAALRASALRRRDQGRALLPWMLRYQVPIWPERSLTRHDGAELERLVRSRSSAAWQAGDDFAETIGHLRRAIQIPSAAHSALEYQRWAARSQLRGEGRRFMRSMKRPISVPVLHLRGDGDPYVLADPVNRTRQYAPHGRYASIAGAGHYAHEEAPGQVNDQLTRFLEQVYTRPVS